MDSYRYKISASRLATDNLLLLELVPLAGETVFSFRPGQYVMISYRNSRGQLLEKHSFSLASSPDQTDRLKLGIRVGGPFTTGLAALPLESEIAVWGPYGSFFLDENKHSQAVMIAGGIGVTPLASMFLYAAKRPEVEGATMLYSARTLADLAYYQELTAAARTRQKFKFYCLVSETVPPGIPNIRQEKISGELLQKIVGNFSGVTFFLCGPPGFIAMVSQQLQDAGVAPSAILSERFTMISSAAKDRLKILKAVFSPLALAAAAAIIPFVLIQAAIIKKAAPVADQASLSSSSLPVQNLPAAVTPPASVVPVENEREQEEDDQPIINVIDNLRRQLNQAPSNSSSPTYSNQAPRPGTRAS